MSEFEYTDADFNADTKDLKNFRHTESRERYQSFYNKAGATAVKNGKKGSFHSGNHIRGWLEPTEGGYLLELGCSVANNLVPWLKNDPELKAIGVDVSDVQLEWAEEYAKDKDVWDRLRLIHGFLEDTTLENLQPERAFTDIVLAETIEHVQDHMVALEATVRLMSSETTLWITAPNKRSGNAGHVRGVPEDELEEWLQEMPVELDYEITTHGSTTRARVTLS